MATFSITVTGVPTNPVLNSPTETHSSCQSTFDMKVNALTGQNVTLTWTPTPGGYINYIVTLDTGSGYASISSGHVFTPNGTAFLRVVMENSGTEELLQISMNAQNNTTLETVVQQLFRNGLAGIC